MNLDKISVSGTSLTVRALKPAQEYGQFGTITMHGDERATMVYD